MDNLEWENWEKFVSLVATLVGHHPDSSGFVEYIANALGVGNEYKVGLVHRMNY